MALDDRDMKIAGDRPSRNMVPPADEIENITQRLISEKKQGLFDKAEKLGEELVSSLLDSDDFIYDDSDTDTYNKRVLLAFSAISSIEEHICNENTASEALNSLLEAIRQRDKRLYDDICGAGELSFYYLALKRGGNAELSIGKMFAMICGREDDEEYISKGTDIYTGFESLVKAKIDEYGLGCDDAE